MAIAVACECGARFRVKEENSGKRARCPKCRNVIKIAQAATTAGTSSNPAYEPSTPSPSAVRHDPVDPVVAASDSSTPQSRNIDSLPVTVPATTNRPNARWSMIVGATVVGTVLISGTCYSGKLSGRKEGNASPSTQIVNTHNPQIEQLVDEQTLTFDELKPDEFKLNGLIPDEFNPNKLKNRQQAPATDLNPHFEDQKLPPDAAEQLARKLAFLPLNSPKLRAALDDVEQLAPSHRKALATQLVSLVQENDRDLRLGALKAMIKVIPPSSANVRPLIEAILDEDEEIRSAATTAFANANLMDENRKLLKEFVTLLDERLTDGTPDDWKFVSEAIRLQPPTTRFRAVGVLLDLLKPASNSRHLALMCLLDYDGHVVGADFKTLLNSKNARVRTLAEQAQEHLRTLQLHPIYSEVGRHSLRTWTDTKGNTIRAKLAPSIEIWDRTNDKVVLRTVTPAGEDDKILAFPIDNFSQGDLDFLGIVRQEPDRSKWAIVKTHLKVKWTALTVMDDYACDGFFSQGIRYEKPEPAWNFPDPWTFPNIKSPKEEIGFDDLHATVVLRQPPFHEVHGVLQTILPDHSVVFGVEDEEGQPRTVTYRPGEVSEIYRMHDSEVRRRKAQFNDFHVNCLWFDYGTNQFVGCSFVIGEGQNLFRYVNTTMCVEYTRGTTFEEVVGFWKKQKNRDIVGVTSTWSPEWADKYYRVRKDYWFPSAARRFFGEPHLEKHWRATKAEERQIVLGGKMTAKQQQLFARVTQFWNSVKDLPLSSGGSGGANARTDKGAPEEDQFGNLKFNFEVVDKFGKPIKGATVTASYVEPRFRLSRSEKERVTASNGRAPEMTIPKEKTTILINGIKAWTGDLSKGQFPPLKFKQPSN